MAKHLIPETGHSPNLQRWFDWMAHDHSPAGLAPLLADEVVFKSPVVHAPQVGKPITMGYLLVAFVLTLSVNQVQKGDLITISIPFTSGRKNVKRRARVLWTSGEGFAVEFL